VAFANNVANANITSVTLGGVAMTQLGSTLFCGLWSGFSGYVAVFILPNILGGAQNLVVTPAYSTTYLKSNVVAYPSVRSWATPVTTTGTGTAMSHTVSSAAKRIVAQCFVPVSPPSISGYNQNSRWNNNTGTWTTPVQIGDAAGAASVPFTATASSSVPWGSMAVELS
jgi:hypothetical protein